jgi:hypothetical protein
MFLIFSFLDLLGKAISLTIFLLLFSAHQRPNAVDDLLFPHRADYAGDARAVQRDGQ